MQDGTGRARLPGAADAMRRGRRRALRARGGVALAGVAAIGGALGIGSAFGPGSGAGPLGAAAGARPGVHADDGMLPAEQWPGYDVEHWKPLRLNQPNLDRIAVMEEWCVDVTKAVSSKKHVAFAAGYDDTRKLDAFEDVFTFSDSKAAADFMAGARHAGAAKTCRFPSGPVYVSPGVSTADGVSWKTDQPSGSASTAHTHAYLVQVDDRVALLQVSQEGAATYQSTRGDALVLRNLAAALSR